MSDSVAADQIRAFVDRILRLKGEAKDINRDIREVYGEAKGNGFDKTVLGKLVSYVEKRANGAADLQEAEALFDLYLSAYDGASHTHAREEASEDDWQAMRQWASARIASGVDIQPAGNSGEFTEPEAAMLPQTGAVETLVANSQVVPPDQHVGGNDAIGLAGPAWTADPQPANIKPAPFADLTQPNPICRDPSDCGVYASWHHPCLACKRAANVARAA